MFSKNVNLDDREVNLLSAFIIGNSLQDIYVQVPNESSKIDEIFNSIISKMNKPSSKEFLSNAYALGVIYQKIKDAVINQQYEKAADARDEFEKLYNANFNLSLNIIKFFNNQLGKSYTVGKEEGLEKILINLKLIEPLFESDSKISLYISPGTATKEEIAELLTELSTLYRMIGGSGISFVQQDVRHFKNVS